MATLAEAILVPQRQRERALLRMFATMAFGHSEESRRLGTSKSPWDVRVNQNDVICAGTFAAVEQSFS
jgi:hypothetical protein